MDSFLGLQYNKEVFPAMFVMCFDLFIVKAFYSSEAVDGILLRHVLCKENFL